MWNNLSMADKAKLISVAVQNGITNLNDIQTAYNTFAEGGSTENPGPLDGVVAPSDINVSDIEKQSQWAVDFGNFAKSTAGKIALPIVEWMRERELKQQMMTMRQRASNMAMAGNMIGMVPGLQGIGLALSLPDLLYDGYDLATALRYNNPDAKWRHGISLGADLLGFIPGVTTNLINATDDVLQAKGSNTYDYLKQGVQGLQGVQGWNTWNTARKGFGFSNTQRGASAPKKTNKKHK